MASIASTMPAYMLPGVPVCQPSHLEGDSSLATEILPGPPSLTSASQSLAKRDPKKPSINYSYLPASDPGTTYSGIMHGTLIGQELGSPRKRPRVEKRYVHHEDSSPDHTVSDWFPSLFFVGLSLAPLNFFCPYPLLATLSNCSGTSGRAQRASARSQNNLNGAVSDSLPTNEAAGGSALPPVSGESDVQMILDDAPTLSRSNSSQNIQEGPSNGVGTRGKRKDKGKGKEVEPMVRVKEEPKAISLHSPEPQSNLVRLLCLSFSFSLLTMLSSAQLNNNDHCSACRSIGSLVYCDGCPRAFHLWCVDPPIETVDEGKWYCRSCTVSKVSCHVVCRSLSLNLD